MIIHKCENEHKCRSVREDESDSENVRLWLCRIDDDDGLVVEDEDVNEDEFEADELLVDVVLEFVEVVLLEDELAVEFVRVVLFELSIL